MGDESEDRQPAAFGRGAAGEWAASRYEDVQAVLADPRFEVGAAASAEETGTISWLRASVSRFCNGELHQQRRALAAAQLARLDPAGLRAAARQRTHAALSDAGKPGDRVDVMAKFARWAPMAAMAEPLGATDPGAAAAAVIQCARGYFPGASDQTLRRADTATARLLRLLGAQSAGLDVTVARIALMVQGCDATAGLIGTALHLLADPPAPAARAPARGWPVEALLAEVLRHSPPVRASRRVAAADADFAGHTIAPGDAVVCSVDAANRDPGIFERPGEFDPGRRQQPSLTFGYGVRPCPGVDQALMLAAGVVETVTQRCRLLPGQQIEWEDSPLRIPRRLEVVLG